ncbi:MAG TPA: DNA polymerase III subunit gamma/tau [Candidatus Collinsella stercoripullorum]|nr:DNA polymerase III subunit gamma/tau [Candidatus Collinsella stercoripullorum]
MESLYRTYRPLTFESVVGQQHIVSTLRHAVTEGRLSHAYLFCGPRGTGKTTMARILAKALLCEHAEAARAEGASGCMPDGSCPECEAIAEGTHPDVYELDAASRTGVDNVREEIISSVSFAPVRGAYKVYIIDEVHMLTTAAFNALLKTLEEPPSHVVFVLCTTDPQKIPETILSRCQRFDFHRISNEDIVGRLRYICGQEGFEADDEALEIVARHARGGMRDALSTLEQLSVFGDGTVRVADARALLGEVSSTVLGEFARAIAARDVVALFGMVRRQVDEGNDLMEFTRDLVAHVRDVYTARVAGTQGELFDGTPDEVAALADEAAAFEGADRLARVLTVLDNAAIEMRTAADARLVLEIACTRLARPESDLTLEALAERLDRIEAQLAAGVPSAPLDAAGVAALTGAGRVAGRGAASAAPSAGRAPAGAAAPVTGKTSPKASAGPASAGAAPKASEPAEDLPWNAPAARTAAPAPVTAPSASNAPAPASAMGGAPASPAASASSPAPAPAASGASEPTSSEGRAASSTPAPARPSPQGAAGEAAPMGGARSPLGARSVSAPASAAGTPEAAPAPASSGMRAPAPSVTGASAPDAAAPAPGAAAGEPSPASPRSAGDPGELQRRWADVVKRVTAAQASRGALLQSSRARSDDGERLVIGFPKGSGFAVKMLGRPDSHELIAPIVEAVFGPRVVDYVMDGEGAQASAPSAPGSPSQGAAPVRAAGPSASRDGADAAAGMSPASSPVQGGPQGASSPVAASPEGAPAPDGSAPSAGSSSVQAAAGVPSVRAAGAPSGGSAEPAPGPATPSAPGTPRPAGVPAAPRPAGVPAQAGPAESAPSSAGPGSAAAVDQTSGPTVVPERDIDADRRAWEDEQVPYDDAMIASYEDEEIPPFDIPGADAFAAPAPARPAPGGTPAPATGAAPAVPVPSAGPAVPAPASPAAPSRQAPSAGAPGAVPWAGATRASDAEETQVPQTEQEAKDLLNSVFGAGVVFRSE